MKKVDGKGLRANEGKRRVDLLPVSAINAMADVMTFGAKKYAARNWERGMKWSICYASLMRHLLAWWGGEDTDSESGLPHLSHILCNAAFLTEYAKTCPSLDDRVKEELNLSEEDLKHFDKPTEKAVEEVKELLADDIDLDQSVTVYNTNVGEQCFKVYYKYLAGGSVYDIEFSESMTLGEFLEWRQEKGFDPIDAVLDVDRQEINVKGLKV